MTTTSLLPYLNRKVIALRVSNCYPLLTLYTIDTAQSDSNRSTEPALSEFPNRIAYMISVLFRQFLALRMMGAARNVHFLLSLWALQPLSCPSRVTVASYRDRSQYWCWSPDADVESEIEESKTLVVACGKRKLWVDRLEGVGWETMGQQGELRWSPCFRTLWISSLVTVKIAVTAAVLDKLTVKLADSCYRVTLVARDLQWDGIGP